MRRLFLLCYMWICVCAYKSLILKPGGLKGFYMMGICRYIKEHYDLQDWKFYGSSAGAWNALYLVCNKDDFFLSQAYELSDFEYTDLYDLEKTIKKRMLNHFSIYDFDLSRLHICISSKRRWLPMLRKNIVRDFRDLDDVIECCITSSHLPFISNGRLFYKYRNIPCMDGGAFLNPHEKHIQPDYVIEPDMWKNKKIDTMNRMYNLNIPGLFNQGYLDARNHKDELNDVFLYKTR